jgi:hypothetical protein
MHYQDDFAMKWQGLLLISFTLVLLILLTGCLNVPPVSQTTPQGTFSPHETTVVLTPQVTASVTIPAGVRIPQETPVPVPAYVKRPFGYVQYVYNPAHMVTLQESHVETDTSGARTIVGTIKNTGSERVDLVVVTANLYNANGNVIGSTNAEVSYFEPDKIWKFRTESFTMSDFAYHQIAEIFTG